jgi:hypothetical protein
MALVVPMTIQTATLQALLAVDLKLRLYSNVYEPGPASVIASFTEVVGGGYAAEDLLSADWTYGSVSPVVASQTVKTFGFTGATSSPSVVYGYYVTDVAGATLYWAEALPGTYYPYTPANTGYIKIFPSISLSGGST